MWHKVAVKWCFYTHKTLSNQVEPTRTQRDLWRIDHDWYIGWWYWNTRIQISMLPASHPIVENTNHGKQTEQFQDTKCRTIQCHWQHGDVHLWRIVKNPPATQGCVCCLLRELSSIYAIITWKHRGCSFRWQCRHVMMSLKFLVVCFVPKVVWSKELPSQDKTSVLRGTCYLKRWS